MSAIPSTSSSSSSSVANTTSLISNAITSSLGSVVYRVKWSNSHNSSWLNQNRDGLCSREQTQLLFDQLVDSKEIIVNPKPAVSYTESNNNVALPDFDFGKPTLNEHKRYLSSQLNAQMDMVQAVCLDSPFFSLLRKRLLVAHRMLYALYFKYHDTLNALQSSSSKKLATPMESNITLSKSFNNKPTEALIEIGVRTSLSLVFSLLRVNGIERQTEHSSLCLEVLETAKGIIFSLPLMSLKETAEKKLPAIGISSLNEVTKFLKEIVAMTSSTPAVRNKSAEILLGIALQRYSLQFFLEWIEMSLIVACQSNEVKIDASTFLTTLCSLHQDDNTSEERIELISKQMKEKYGSEDIPLYAAASTLMNELVILTTRAVTAHEFSFCSNDTVKSWTDFNLSTLKLLKNFILTYCEEVAIASNSPPFPTIEDNINFILRCLDLIQLLRKVERQEDEAVLELRGLFSKMLLEQELPHRILQSVADTLRAEIFLPPLGEMLSKLLALLKEIHTLSYGQSLFCEITFDSLLHHEKICQLISVAPNSLPEKDAQLTTDLIKSLLVILTEHGCAVLDGVENTQSNKSECPELMFNQKMQELVMLLHDHMFAEISNSGSNVSGTHVWILLENHLSVYFESVRRILKKAEEVLLRTSKEEIVFSTLQITMAGSMLNKVIHFMLLPINHNFQKLLDHVIFLLKGLNSIIRKCSGSLKESFENEYFDDGKIWFFDMERCCGFLVGKLIGDLIRGAALCNEEHLTNSWLNNNLFSHGLEPSSSKLNIKETQEAISKISVAMTKRSDFWIEDVMQILKSEFSTEHEKLFSMGFRSTRDGLFDLFIEHGLSLDWQNFDTGDDVYIDSCSRLVLLCLIKHSSDIANLYNSMSPSRRRQDKKIHEIFALVYHFTNRLLLVKQNELLLVDEQSNQAQEADNLSLQASVHAAKDSETSNSSTASVSTVESESQPSSRLIPCYLQALDVSAEQIQENASRQLNLRGPICAGLNSTPEQMAHHIRDNIVFATTLNIVSNSPQQSSTEGVPPIFSSSSLNLPTQKMLTESEIKDGNEVTVERSRSSSSSYTSIALSIIEKCLVLLLFVKSSVPSNQKNTTLDDSTTIHEADILQIRRLGKNALRFLAYNLTATKFDAELGVTFDKFTSQDKDTEGWNSETVHIIQSLKRQEKRALQRIEALSKMVSLISSHQKEEPSDLASQEYFIAGCFQLGITSPIQLNVKPDSVCLVLPNIDRISNMDYMGRIQASPYEIQQQVKQNFHKIMRTLILNLRDQALKENGHIISRSSSTCPLNVWDENEDFVHQTIEGINLHAKYSKDMEFQLLDLFSLSFGHNASDIKLAVDSGLLTILEKLSNANRFLNESKQNHDNYLTYMSEASARLLYIIGVSAAIHSNEMETEILEKISEVLYDHLASDLILLCGNSFQIPDSSTDTPRVAITPNSSGSVSPCDNTTSSQEQPPELQLPTPLISEKLEMENRVGALFVFLRRIITECTIGKFFCKANWIKLILSFLSLKPKLDAFVHLDEDEEFHSNLAFSLNVLATRDIVFMPDLNLRLKALHLLESILNHLTDSSDLNDYVVQKLIQQLSNAMWNVPMYDRAKKNLLSYEEVSRNSNMEDLRFDSGKASSCLIENGQTLIHDHGGRGYCLTTAGFSSGCHSWKFLIVKENRHDGICVGVSRWPMRDGNPRGDDMYLYRSNGNLVCRKGELPFTLGSFNQGDFITCLLDVDNGCLSFGKNGEEPIPAFHGISSGKLYPCVLFYSVSAGEKVKITDYETKRCLTSLLPGDPYCAPLAVVLSEAYVSLIRHLHSLEEGWNKAVNDSLVQCFCNGKDAVLYSNEHTPTPLTEEDSQSEGVVETEHKLTLNSFEVIENLCKEVWPALAVIGGIDSGIMMGRRCLHKSSGKRLIVLGAHRPGLRSVKVQWEHDDFTIGDVNVLHLEPISDKPFDASKFTSLTSDILEFLTKLSGMTDEIRFPNQDIESPFENIFTRKQEPLPNNDLSTNVDAEEATEISFWNSIPISSFRRNSNLHTSQNCVDMLSNKIVTDIISEVTRKSSQDVVHTPQEVAACYTSLTTKVKAELELENAFVKIAFIQCGAMKSLGNIFSCPYFSELILTPQKPNCPPEKRKKELDGKSEQKDEITCPICNKMIPSFSEGCPYCQELTSLKTALFDAFQHFVNFCLGPLRIQKLVRISDLERIQSIIHQSHVKQLVDSTIGKRNKGQVHQMEDVADREEQTFNHSSSVESLPSTSRSTSNHTSYPQALLEAEHLGMQLMALGRGALESTINRQSIVDSHTNGGRVASSAIALRRRLRRSPSPPQTSVVRQRLPGRIPNVLIEMGFSHSHVARAMNSLNVTTAEPPISVISSLASWMIENPDSAEEDRVDSRASRPWLLSPALPGATRERDHLSERRQSSLASEEQSSSTGSTRALSFPDDTSLNSGSGNATASNNVNRCSQPIALHSDRCGGFRIPIVNVPANLGEIGLCYFCSDLETDIAEHFLRKHTGCNQMLSEGSCGEIRDNSYWLCFDCYVHARGLQRQTKPSSSVSLDVNEEVSLSVALPPLTHGETDNFDDAFDSSSCHSLPADKFKLQCDEEFSSFLPYLSLSGSKPYSNFIRLKDADVLGSESIEKVTETKLKPPYENARHLIEQAVMLDNERRIQALQRTTEACTLLLARNAVVKVLTLLSISDSDELSQTLVNLGFSGVNKLIRLMYLVAADRVGGIDDEENRFYNSSRNRFILFHSLELPYDVRICITLSHIGKAVEAAVVDEEAGRSVVDLCIKALVKAAVGFDSNEKTQFSVVLCLINMICTNPGMISIRQPRSPVEPNEDLSFINALSLCSISSRMGARHRAFCLEQLVKFLSNRKKLVCSSENYNDFAGAMKCQVLEIAEHENRVSSMVWSNEKKLLCTAGGSTIRTYSLTPGKAAENERVLMLHHKATAGNENGDIISAITCAGSFVVAGTSNCLNMWILDGSERSYKEEFRSIVTKLKFSSQSGKDGSRYLLTGFRDGSVSMTAVYFNSLPMTKELLPPDSFGGVAFLDWTSSGGYFAVGYVSGLIKLAKKDRVKPFCQRAHLGRLTCMEFASEEILLTCGDDKFMRIWSDMSNKETGSTFWFCAEEIELDQEPISLACAKNCNWISLGMSNGAVSIWKMNSNDSKKPDDLRCRIVLIHQLRCCPFYYPLTNLVFNTSGELLACGTSKGLVTFWSVQFGTLLYAHTSDQVSGVQEICCIDDGFACYYSRSNCVNVFFYNDQQMSSDILMATCRKSLLEQGLNGYHNFIAFKHLLKFLPNMITEQYNYEKSKIESGDFLLHSRYFQCLAKLALILRLDKVLCTTSKQADFQGSWEWLEHLNTVIKTSEALMKRSELPSNFVEKLQTPPGELIDDFWTLQMDYDIMSWANSSPSDWYLGGKALVYMFGAGRHGQLGIPRSTNLPKLASSFQNVNKIICGQNCTFIVHIDGSVSSIGEGSYGRLGLGSSDDMMTQTVISALQGYNIVQIVTSLGGDGHSAAISADGEVFTWGDGDFGKLGHSNSDRQRRPKQVEFLRQERIIQVAVGSKHTCCLSDKGEVFVFGSCEMGRLGLGICTGNKKQPEKIASLCGIGYIACGLSHTICVSKDGSACWAFGDNENGKLGINNTTTATIPTLVDSFQNMEIQKVVCGSQFSVFLTRTGQLFTCGLDKLCVQSSGRSCTLKPTLVCALKDRIIVDVDAGSEHTICVTSKDEVFVWGSNGEGQLGLGHTLFQREPTEVKFLAGKGIQQVSAGRTHSASWTAPRIEREQNLHSVLGTPTTIPQQYARIQNISIDKIRARLKILQSFSDLLVDTWRFLPLIRPIGFTCSTVDPFYSPTESKLRPLLSSKVNFPFIRTISKTMMQQRTYGPTITVRRISSKGKKKRPIFTQISKQVVQLNSVELRLPARSWKIRLVNEGADDAGGVFDDTVTEMCIELTNGTLPYLIPTPNALNEVGFNRDKFLLNPELVSSEDLEAFKFIGILFGVAIRTKKPIALNFAPLIWKILVGEDIAVDDLEEIDCMYVSGLQSVRDNVANHFNEDNFHEIIPIECFEGTSATGKIVPIVVGGRSIPLTFQNRLDYVDKSIHFRLHEMDLQVAAIREGLSGIIPVPLISLMTGSYLEQLVCGLPCISVDLLKQVVRYREIDESHELVRWLWSVLEEFTNAERVLFIRFVSGRSRLPTNLADFSQRFQIVKTDRPIDSLPTSQTCFFQLRLPPYSSKDKMAEKFRYAINNCTCIDMDNYMLARNGVDFDGDDDDVEIIGS